MGWKMERKKEGMSEQGSDDGNGAGEEGGRAA
jgi:hypothetical protein